MILSINNQNNEVTKLYLASFSDDKIILPGYSKSFMLKELWENIA